MLLTKDRLIAARDPHGFRPLALGQLGDAYIVCSETCALDLIGATYVRDVEPGEVVIISDGGAAIAAAVPAGAARALRLRARLLRAARQLRLRQERQRGAHRARTDPRRGVAGRRPTSSSRFPTRASAPATGFAEASGIPMRMGLIRNHYVGRTFIQPQQAIRHFSVRIKLNPVGASSKAAASSSSTTRSCAARPAARSSRWCAPPAPAKCTCGSPARRRSRRASTASTRRSRSELIAATQSLDEIRDFIEADTLAYLSLDGLLRAVRPDSASYCTSCYTGRLSGGVAARRAAYLQLALKVVE